MSWWALVTVITRASTTITVLAIFTVGIVLHEQGLHQCRRNRDVRQLSTTMLIQKLEQAVSFSSTACSWRRRGCREFFNVLDAVPAVRDRPDAIDPGRLSRPRRIRRRGRFPMTASGRRSKDLLLHRAARPDHRAGGVRPAPANPIRPIALLHRAFDPQSGVIKIDGMDIRGHQADRVAPEYRCGVPGGAAVQPLDRGESAGRQAGCDRRGDALAAARAQAKEFIDRSAQSIKDRSPASAAAAVRRRAPAPVDCQRAAEKPADPDPRRGDQRARRGHRGSSSNAALDEVMKGRPDIPIDHRQRRRSP